jgi:hypothetical protein
VFGLIDGESLRDAVLVRRVRVVPTRLEFLESDPIRCIAVYFIRAHVDERRFRRRLPRRFEQIERTDRVRVEIVERNGSSAIVRRLRGGVDDDIRADGLQQGEDARAIADIEFMVNETFELVDQPVLVPTRVALRAEEDRSLIVVHAVDSVSKFAREIDTHFRADEAGGTGYEKSFGHGMGSKSRANIS